MSPNLYPTFEAPVLVGQRRQAEVRPRYGRSFAFDFERGDFVLDGAGRVLATDGHTAWAHWCVKTILTERFAFLIYGRGYGTELEAALRQDRARVPAAVERAIREALVADPRTREVRDVVVTHEADALQVTATVVPTVGTAQRIEVRLRYG